MPTIERAQHAEIIRERLARRRRTKSKEDVPQLVDANGDIGDPFLVLDTIDKLGGLHRLAASFDWQVIGLDPGSTMERRRAAVADRGGAGAGAGKGHRGAR
jgi:hypothetical protein